MTLKEEIKAMLEENDRLARANAKLLAALDEAHALGLAAKVMLRNGGGQYVARGNLGNALVRFSAAQQRAINRSVT